MSTFDPFAIAGAKPQAKPVTKQDIVDSNFRRRGQEVESKSWYTVSGLDVVEYAKRYARVRVRYHEPSTAPTSYKLEVWDVVKDLKFEVKEKWVTIAEAIKIYGLSEDEALSRAEFPMESEYKIFIMDSLTEMYEETLDSVLKETRLKEKKPEGFKPQKHYLEMKQHPTSPRSGKGKK